jgi:integrase
MVRPRKKPVTDEEADRAARRALHQIHRGADYVPIPRENRKPVGKFHKIAIYTRAKNAAGKWRYLAVRLAPGYKHPDPPFFLRYTQDFKQRFSPPYDSLEEAKKGAAKLRAALDAKERGLTVSQLDELENVNRVTIERAVETFLALKNGKAVTTRNAYRLHLHQFIASTKVRFLDEITADTIRNFNRVMESEGLSGRTRHNRLMTVAFLLKKNKVPNPMPRDEMPVVEVERAIAYTSDELDKLFVVMNDRDKLLFNFFISSAAREREVMYAAWKDIDFARGIYHVRRKEDVGFTPKSHESREVPLPTELVKQLKLASKNPKHPRWVFVSADGNPDGHILRRLKELALRAGLNCGHCVTRHTVGDGAARKSVEVSCKDKPVCEHWYLHRLRKTCATRWQESGIPVRNIQTYLGHKDLETTMRYLGVTDTEKLRDEINRASQVR